ncbi:MAG: hypothetical protein F4Y90_07870, partial [Rhodothermaceae bacterium]|nr:hypothetical protein [Rhodothermaceae bacterium]
MNIRSLNKKCLLTLTGFLTFFLATPKKRVLAQDCDGAIFVCAELTDFDGHHGVYEETEEGETYTIYQIEEGATFTFKVRLPSAISENVGFTYELDDLDLSHVITLSSEITFTPSNWEDKQPVSLKVEYKPGVQTDSRGSLIGTALIESTFIFYSFLVLFEITDVPPTEVSLGIQSKTINESKMDQNPPNTTNLAAVIKKEQSVDITIPLDVTPDPVNGPEDGDYKFCEFNDSNDCDITLTTPEIIIKKGKIVGVIALAALADTDEDNEILTVELGDLTKTPRVIAGSPSEHTITIIDVDKPEVSLVVEPTTVFEGDEVKIHVTVSEVLSNAVTIELKPTHIHTDDDDYRLQDPFQVTIPAN